MPPSSVFCFPWLQFGLTSSTELGRSLCGRREYDELRRLQYKINPSKYRCVGVMYVWWVWVCIKIDEYCSYESLQPRFNFDSLPSSRRPRDKRRDPYRRNDEDDVSSLYSIFSTSECYL